MCLRVLAERSQLLLEVFGEKSRNVLAQMLQHREQENKSSHTQVKRGHRSEVRWWLGLGPNQDGFPGGWKTVVGLCRSEAKGTVMAGPRLKRPSWPVQG